MSLSGGRSVAVRVAQHLPQPGDCRVQAILEVDDEGFRLLGLKWAGGSKKLISAATDALIAKQRADGGWAQIDERESDA